MADWLLFVRLLVSSIFNYYHWVVCYFSAFLYLFNFNFLNFFKIVLNSLSILNFEIGTELSGSHRISALMDAMNLVWWLVNRRDRRQGSMTTAAKHVRSNQQCIKQKKPKWKTRYWLRVDGLSSEHGNCAPFSKREFKRKLLSRAIKQLWRSLLPAG